MGGYQQEIVLKCAVCNKSIRFVTDWSPILDFHQVNEISGMIQDAVCPYLSIQKKDDCTFLLRCCSNFVQECFGRSFEDCYSYHKTKLDEFLKAGNFEKAETEAKTSIEQWKKENPDELPPLGTHELVEIKRRTLSQTDWIRWIKNQLGKLENAEDFGSAASIAFSVAETYEEPDFWNRASQNYDRYGEKLKANLDKDGWFKKLKKEREIAFAEAMSLEARSEIDQTQKSELLRSAGDKWLELFRLSADPFSHPQLVYHAYYFRNYALARPEDAPERYKEAYEFLLLYLDKLEYPWEKVYYEGHAKFFLGQYYLSLANSSRNQDNKVSLLEKSIQELSEAIDLHERIGLTTMNIRTMVYSIKAVVCVERFSRDQNFSLIREAKGYLETAETYRIPHKYIDLIRALIGSYEEALSAVENPTQAISLVAQARKNLDLFVRLLPNLNMRDIPIPSILEFQKHYLSLYLETIARTVTSFAGKTLSFNNICTSLEQFRSLVERQLYPAFKETTEPSEEIGRSLVQAILSTSFPQAKLQFREVKVAEGRSDNMLIVDNEKYPFEVKIWRGELYYQKGLRQIKYYIDHENVEYGFYIIFDPRVNDYKSGYEIVKYNSRKIGQVFIQINPRKP
jgi:hypothetical protein